MEKDSNQIKVKCQVCRQPFFCAADFPAHPNFKFNNAERVICPDCCTSLKQWLRTREEVGLENLEKGYCHG